MDAEESFITTAEEYEKYLAQKHLLDRPAHSSEDVSDSFGFKSKLIDIPPEIADILSKDIVISNFSDKDKQKALAYLALTLDLIELGLDGSIFFKEVRIIAGVSRGHRGFQQDKFNETKDIKISKLDGIRKRRGFFKRG